MTNDTIPAVADQDFQPSPAGPRDAGPARLTDLHLLLVDDEKTILKTFSLMLQDQGFSLKTASNGEDALALVKAGRFDIVFLDQHIGRERGLDIMQTMAALDPSLYFVIITANGSAGLAVEALKRGASDFVMKPFFVADLLRSIDFVLRKRTLERERKELLLSLEQKVRERTLELQSIHLDVLGTLAQALEARDFGTFGHCKRVSRAAGLLCEKLSLGDEERHQVEVAALLHDVGKIGIGDLILLKPDKLNKDEWTTLKDHPSKGAEILRPLKYLEPALPGILHHHENYDGTGYPAGLKGEEIPLMARIISVADAWDVMRSDRPYRTARTEQEAVKELRRCSGTQFDPVIVDIFVQSLA